MLGDHLQLRPNPADPELAAESGMEVSQFERMIKNGAEVPMLNEQRRMRPLIAKLVRVIYPDLTNHATTLGRPKISGVDLETPVFFLDHSAPETSVGHAYVAIIDNFSLTPLWTLT